MRGHDGNGPAAAGRAGREPTQLHAAQHIHRGLLDLIKIAAHIFRYRRHGPDPARTARRPPDFPDCGWFHTWPAMPGKGRVRARKLRQRRWRCVTGTADPRRRDRRLCPCQLRAGGLCAGRGRRACDLLWRGEPPGLPYGVQLGFMGVQLGGKVIGAGLPGCGCGGDWRAAAGGCHCASLMMKRRAAAAAVRPFVWPGPGSLPSSFPQVTCLGRSGGSVLCCSPARCGPRRPCRVSLEW